jgi:hypothetical protein
MRRASLLVLPLLLIATMGLAAASPNDLVLLNTSSLKYHCLNCSAAKSCTRCIRVKRSEAKQRGGVPCRICGGCEG